MIDAHHVRSILTIANFVNTDAFALQGNGLVCNADWRFDVVCDYRLVGWTAREVLAVNRLNLLLAFIIEAHAGHDIAIAAN